MAWRRIISTFLLSAAACLNAGQFASASAYRGEVSFAGSPVPGVTVIATNGATKFSTVTDQGGVYAFPDLADGPWKIEIQMQCFSTIKADVTIVPNMPAAKWELVLLPADQLIALSKLVQAQPTSPPLGTATTPAKKQDASAANAPVEIPKAPDDANQQSSDGFLVNGSVNNAATSQFSLDRAFGNRRYNSKSLYNGGLAAIFDNSALDAAPYSLTGLAAPKPFYNRITGVVTLGGPLKIPHLLPHGPDFFAAYQWTRNQIAQTESGLVPTDAERSGDLSSLPVTLFNPATGLPFANNAVPVSSQAQALLQFYPEPDIAGNLLYNYQAPVLNSTHQDVVQTRFDKTLGRKDQLYGSFALQSTRAASVNLFGFVDTTGSLGINTNINWAHRINPHLFGYTTYRFSRLRTLVVPEFEKRQNVSANAGISGNDQDPTDWGPPALNFSSGIAALSDADSSFNRNRTDGFSASVALYRGRHNVTTGGDFRKQEYNQFFQQNPRGAFTFTGAATAGNPANTTGTGSDLADFLIGTPDTSSIAYGNADKYFRQPVYDAYLNDDWRLLSILTINAGIRWEYGAPMTELKGRLVNLDLAPGFTAAAPVLGSNPTGSVTGDHYPSSLIRPDKRGIEPRIGISWRPIPASTVVIRAGYGIYHDTSVYLASVQQLAQQAPLSTSLNVQNSAACPLTLADGFTPCASVTPDNYAVDPNFRVGYAQTWQVSLQRDLPAALQLTATYLGVKGTHGVQQFLPNTYPESATNPCPACPLGFEYRTSGGDSTRESGQVQLRRRLRSGFTASLLYTFSKSIDDDAILGGLGHVAATNQTQPQAEAAPTPQPTASASIAQNWLNLRAERGPSTFDQRHLLNLQAQYTTGQGLEGGTLLGGWRGRALKEWTILTTVVAGTGLPETPTYLAAVPGTGFTGTIRPSLTGVPIYTSATFPHLNASAYTAPPSGQWGNAGRDSIRGPAQFSLDTTMNRTFRPSTKFYFDAGIEATNLLNHAAFTGWITTVNSAQFGLPLAANPMRSLQVTARLRF